jgi:hypothetical protein
MGKEPNSSILNFIYFISPKSTRTFKENYNKLLLRHKPFIELSQRFPNFYSLHPHLNVS